MLNTSGYLLVLILGSFLGYLTSAYLSDRIGRRHCFMLFACSAGVLIVTYTQIPITDSLMLCLASRSASSSSASSRGWAHT